HFPLEPDVLNEELGPFEGGIIAPCFFEAGRYTVHGVHWVAQGDVLVPVAQTEFARDPTFGFSHSYLPAWVQEKTGGRWSAGDVLVLDAADVRAKGPAYVADVLMRVVGGQPVVVDALAYADLERAVAGLLEAEARGKRFLYRTGASFLRVRAGIAPRPLLTREEMLDVPAPARGLVAVGSFVPRSTRQLHRLLEWPAAAGVELSTAELLRPGDAKEVVGRVVREACAEYAGGRIPVIYTSRGLQQGETPE
ncbi:MAG: four-carbon acid sugar kinase family protein, partial [Anaerolineae bacterium]